MSGFVEGWDRRQSALPSDKAKAAMGVEGIELLADAGDFSGEESLACEAMGVTPMCPSPSPREPRRRASSGELSHSLGRHLSCLATAGVRRRFGLPRTA